MQSQLEVQLVKSFIERAPTLLDIERLSDWRSAEAGKLRTLSKFGLELDL